MPKLAKNVLESPFFRRNYGGFTPEQQDFCESILSPAAGLRVLDPMGGQGYLIHRFARRQGIVWVGDANPAPLLLATLRDPDLILKRNRLRTYITDRLRPLSPRKTSITPRSRPVDDWIAPSVREDIHLYSEIFRLDKFGDLLAGSTLWDASPYVRFAACLPVLCARRLVCFHMSDNATWPKPGGFLREGSIYGALMRALDEWCDYAKALEVDVACSAEQAWGTFKASFMNAELGDFGKSPSPNAIITSPPYANRLDYTRMWAPELQLVSAMFNTDPGHVKRTQIGTTVVEGMEVESLESEELPKEVRRALAGIRSDTSSKASASYYYPFFLNYAVTLKRALLNMAERLQPKGYLIVFVRDTLRKDTLFPTGRLVERVLKDGCQFTLLKKENRIIRSHIGLMRRRRPEAGVHDMAQQEWWLAFRKGET